MIKIALITDKFMPGGGLQQILQIVTHLSDFSYAVIANNGDGVEQFRDLPAVRLFTDGYSRDAIHSFQPDLIHVHHLKPLLQIYDRPFMKPSVPIVFTLHGAHIHKYEFRRGPMNYLAYRMRFILEKNLFKRVDHLIVVSLDDADFLREKYGLQNCHYIPNGVDASKFSDISESSGSLLRKEFQLPENSFIFLMPARFDFVKGHDILLKAISRLKEKPEIQQALFILAGEGPEKGKIRKLASELEVDHLIQFLPHISPVKNLLVAGDALLIPSRWEAFPLIIPEAGFCKIPVIASHTYGIRRLIRHEENGLLFENENYRQLAAIISEILLGEHNLQQLAQKLYQESRQKFTLHKSMSELRKTYFRLTDGEN